MTQPPPPAALGRRTTAESQVSHLTCYLIRREASNLWTVTRSLTRSMTSTIDDTVLLDFLEWVVKSETYTALNSPAPPPKPPLPQRVLKPFSSLRTHQRADRVMSVFSDTELN